MKEDQKKVAQIKEDLITTLRALVADESLNVNFDANLENNFLLWNQNLVEKDGERSQVFLPEIKQNTDSHKQSRAAFDMAACYVLAHDKKSYQADLDRKNLHFEEKKFFDEFEKIRVIAEAKNSYLGVVKNILKSFESSLSQDVSSASFLLLGEIFSDQISSRSQSVIANLKKDFSPKVISEIKKLTKNTSNQSEFVSGVTRVLEILKQENDLKQSQEDQKEPGQNQAESPKKPEDDLTSYGQETIESKEDMGFGSGLEQESSKSEIDEQRISEFKEEISEDNSGNVLENTESKSGEIEFKNSYKVFTNKFDEVIFPQKLTGKSELESLRDQLDIKVSKLSTISKKMSLKLKRKLMSKRISFVESDASRGVLDRKKLSRVVIDPLIEDIWVNVRDRDYQDTVLTILLDNSGSMRGNPIVMSAMACEIIAEILERFSIRTEIIGFTTADWKGGRARKLWESSGRPKNPGRLNELRHIIYKHFNQKFKKAKVNLGLMLREGILKENIDGEALIFARSRLMQQSERRKILLVISDGTPVDDSTVSANDSDILSDHLRHVVHKIEKSNRVEIVGIGIGHTTEEFYRNSITIKSLDELGDVMIEKIVGLL